MLLLANEKRKILFRECVYVNTYVKMWKNHVKETRATSMTSSEAATRGVL